MHHNARAVFGPTNPSVDMGTFITTGWKSMYGDMKDMIPPDALVYRGKDIDLRLFVDSDHVGEHFTRRLGTGFVIYLSMAPLVWFSKRHPTVESSVIGAEFVVMKNGIETRCGIHYKLKMMVSPWEVPHLFMGTTFHESILNNKSYSIFYRDKQVCYYGRVNNWVCAVC
jgi:hypothetical protein